MEAFKPLLLKTYGKEKRRLCAWISPDNRKQAFDSSGSKDGSVFESPKQKKTSKRRVAVRKQRAAKEKAKQRLVIRITDDEDTSDEENIMPSPPLPPPPPQLVQQTKRSKSQANMQLKKTFTGKRKSKFVSVPGGLSFEGQQISSSSDREASAPKQLKTSAKMKTRFTGQSSFAGRFVTCRRRAHTKPNFPKELDSLLNSSDDMASGASSATGIHRPSRKRKNPPAFESSSEENSLNAAGISDFVFNPSQDITLNELPGRGLRHCPQKPVFCSTPSASFFSKHAAHKPFPIPDLSTISSLVSVISIKDLCSSQENLVIPSDSIIKQQKQPDLFNQEEPSAVPSATGLSTYSVGPSEYVSATGGLEWLIETLKEKCLTKHCTVQLERLDCNTDSELCSKSTYSSCLEQASSVHCQSANEKPQYRSQTVDLSLQTSQNQQVPLTNDSSQAGNRLKEAASTIGSRTTIISPLVDNEHLAKHLSTQVSVELLESVCYSPSAPKQEDSNYDIIMDTPLPSRKATSTFLTLEEAIAVKNESLGRKCTVQIEKLVLKQLSVHQDTKHQKMECTHNPKEMRSSGEIAESRNVPFKKSKYKSSTGVKQSTESRSMKNTAILVTRLKEECLTKKSTVNIKRVTRSQLKKVKEMLQFKDATMRSPAEPATTDSLSGNDSHNGDHDSLPLKDDMRNHGSASFQHIATAIETQTCDVAPNRKKMHPAPKDRKISMVTNGPGTTRKACVSGLSVSRWKNKKDLVRHKTALMGSAMSTDCSITDFISQEQQLPQDEQKLLGSTMNFSTPLRANLLNLSSLNVHLSPTWSRLKAALSVHRKVLYTPKCLAVDSPERTGLTDVSQDLFAMPRRTLFSRHLHSQLSLNAGEDDLSDAEKVYAECGQQHPLAWEECILPQYMKKCVKIGEGTFGEVFTTTSPSGDTIALKVIPIEGAKKVNGEDQKTFGEILHEIIISKELSSLKEKQNNQTHGFIGLKGLHCVKGSYPPDFLKAWDAFDKRKCSENDRPDFFEEDQIFLILDFEFGGIDLENSNGKFGSLVVAKSILHQVTAALAVAEQELQFEHRDLHWGNVLVKTTKEKTGSFLLNGTAQHVETKGVLVRIIDYSLSRLEIDGLTVSCDISNDEELFMGQGDYQFDIYRLMRQENGNNWSNYRPHTNVLWLHYLCSKLLSMKYRSSKRKDAKDVQKELTRFYDNVLQYGSATEVLQNYPMFQ